MGNSLYFWALARVGFASALREVGLPQNAIPLALLFFNVGVELGQLLFITSVMAVIAARIIVARKLSRSNVTPRFAFNWCESLRLTPSAVSPFLANPANLSFCCMN